MASPAIIELLIQKDSGDCAIACIAMILGVPYTDAYKVAMEIKKDPGTNGLTVAESQKIAKKLVGHGFQSLNPKGTDIDLESETGILFLRMSRSYHAVVLFEGVLLNPADGLIWSLPAYLHAKNAHPFKLLRP